MSKITNLRRKTGILYSILLCATVLIPLTTSLSSEPQLNIPQHRRTKIARSAAKSERRANERRATSRSLCPRCARPSSICVCRGLPPDGRKIALGTHVLVLQHPNEHRRKNVSTVPLMPLVLERFSRRVGYTFDADEVLAEFRGTVLRGGRRPLLLFPGKDASSLDDDGFVDEYDDDGGGSVEDPLRSNNSAVENDEPPRSTSTKPQRLLILFDGTWAEAKRMARDSPSIVDACHLIQFTADTTDSDTDRCIYDSLRKEPERHCLSTLESCGRALLLLEPQRGSATRAVDYLTSALRILVDRQTTQGEAYRPRYSFCSEMKEERDRRVKEIEREIFDGGGGLVGTPMEGGDGTRFVLDDGSILRRLDGSDAQLVDERWERRSPTSIDMVHRRIELGHACFGIFLMDKRGKEGTMCGSILQAEDGSLGMLQVGEEYRRRGYGTTLVSHATRALVSVDGEGVTYILDGNIASEAVFDICGWVKDNPDAKRQTGSRRSKRKWIYKLSSIS